jgi:hypothetical protein
VSPDARDAHLAYPTFETGALTVPSRTRLRRARPTDLLGIYVRDHLTGATGGLALFRRATGTMSRQEHADVLARIEREVTADLRDLRRCAAALDIERPRLREALAIGAERIGRAKLNGQLLGTSPLSPLVEVEALMLGVTGKASCWRVLATSGVADELPDDIDLGQLEARALRQRRDLEQLHHELASLAVGDVDLQGVHAEAELA